MSGGSSRIRARKTCSARGSRGSRETQAVSPKSPSRTTAEARVAAARAGPRLARWEFKGDSFPRGGRRGPASAARRLTAASERVAEAVTQQIKTQDRDQKRESRIDADPGPGSQVALSFGDHRPPRRERRSGAQSQKRKPRLRKNVPRHPERHGDHEGGQGVGQ